MQLQFLKTHWRFSNLCNVPELILSTLLDCNSFVLHVNINWGTIQIPGNLSTRCGECVLVQALSSAPIDIPSSGDYGLVRLKAVRPSLIHICLQQLQPHCPFS